MYKSIYIFLLLATSSFLSAQSNKKYTIEITGDPDHKSYFIVESNTGDTIRKLEKYDYFLWWPYQFDHFAVIGIHKKGWVGIDLNENILFNVDFSDGPFPDFMREDRIRIKDKNGKTGYANEKGEIVIPPRFEMAGYFENGFALIASTCVKVPWEKDEGENPDIDDEHYSLECKRYGYIDKTGKVMKMGKYTYQEIEEEIKLKVKNRHR